MNKDTSILIQTDMPVARLNEISTAIHEDITKCSKYLSVLQTIKIISKSVPCTEGSNSKKSIYSIVDNYFV